MTLTTTKVCIAITITVKNNRLQNPLLTYTYAYIPDELKSLYYIEMNRPVSFIKFSYHHDSFQKIMTTIYQHFYSKSQISLAISYV